VLLCKNLDFLGRRKMKVQAWVQRARRQREKADFVDGVGCLESFV
jgi:hypothetical protein